MAPSEIPKQYRTFKFRLLPSRKQHAALAGILEEQRQLYNGALESRISYYQKTGKSLSHFSMCAQLTELRRDPDFAYSPVRLQRWTLKRLDDAYRGFFGRVKRGQTAGFPRFRGKGRWQSFGFTEFSGIALKGTRLHFKGLSGGLRVHMHRPMPTGSAIASCVIGRDPKGWFVALQASVRPRLLPETGRSVGIDVGLKSLAVLSTGEAIPNARIARRHERELRRRQRVLSRARKGSNGRRKARREVARLHMRIRNSRQTCLHQISARLVRENDLIAVENLNVKGLAAGMLAKSVNDAGWNTLKQMLSYKAAGAGRQLIEVKAAGTSQTCPECGQVAKKTLSQRTHQCDCGCVLDRDHAAAIVILQRAVVRPWELNVAQSGASVFPEISA